MPSWELFDNQPLEYRNHVMPPALSARVAVEQASVFGWGRYAGQSGAIIGMRSFGQSAPAALVARHFGFTSTHVVSAAKEQIARHMPSGTPISGPPPTPA
jgi:transketolase